MHVYRHSEKNEGGNELHMYTCYSEESAKEGKDAFYNTIIAPKQSFRFVG